VRWECYPTEEFRVCSQEITAEPVGKPPHRPGPGEPARAEAEGRGPGKKGSHPCFATAASNARPTVSRPFRPHRVVNLSAQGLGLRPRPWARFSRPVGPDGLGACAPGKPVWRGRDVPSPFHETHGRPTPSGRLRGGNPGRINPNPWRGRELVLSGENERRYRPVVGSSSFGWLWPPPRRPAVIGLLRASWTGWERLYVLR
jgi:hypothetical protein